MAIKNIRYKRYDNAPLELNEISYRYYEKSLGDNEDPASIVAPSNLQADGAAEALTLNEVQSTGEFAIVYECIIKVTAPGTYLFELRTEGANSLQIDGDQLLENDTDTRWLNMDTAMADLSKGSHRLTLTYLRGEDDDPPVLSLLAEGPGIEKHALNTASAVPMNLQTVDIPKIIDPEDKPIVMHGFMDMPDRVHPHSAAVAFPEDIHFGIDLSNGTLMKLWKGEFLDISTMWVGRGGGNLSLDEDAAITFSGAPSMALLSSRDTAWPDSLQENVIFDLNSYRFGDDNQLVMQYQMNGISFEDHLSPHNDGKELKRTILVTDSGSGSDSDLYFRIASGETVSELPNGLYQVNEKTYLISLDEATKNRSWIRRSGDASELLVPVASADNFAISYSYVW